MPDEIENSTSEEEIIEEDVFEGDEDENPNIHEVADDFDDDDFDGLTDEETTEEDTKETNEGFETKYKDLQNNYDRASRHILDLNKTVKLLRQEVQANKSEKETKDVELTDQQIKGLLEAHEGDHGTTLEIIKHVSRQIAKGVSDDSHKAEEIVKTQQELSNYVSQAFPVLEQEGSELRMQVDSFKNKMQLTEHPYGDFLALSGLLHRDIEIIQKEAYEKGVQEGLGKKTNTNRKKTIARSALTPSGKPSTAGTKTVSGLSRAEIAVAKEIGLTSPTQLKLYAQIVSKKK